MNSDFKQRQWDEKQKVAVAQVARALEEFETTNGSSKWKLLTIRLDKYKNIIYF